MQRANLCEAGETRLRNVISAQNDNKLSTTFPSPIMYLPPTCVF